ncbi:MAG: peptidoglycan editing factor PgeF [Tannerellaceae bacterium]|jgi:YfiH family protein|nr:peptidoglycan editing factor PgeF [Tannerellaceae bacterium]
MKPRANERLKILQSPLLAEDGHILHFTTTRHGGLSQGNYASLNLGEYCGDEPDAVRQNRVILCAALGIAPASLSVPHQVHGERSLICGQGMPPGLEADALISCEAGICVAVTTADCVPVLLYAPDRKVVAAVHAGWRGTLKQIAAQTVRRMRDELGCEPRQMLAFIAPAIGLEAFEVGEEVYEAFVAASMDREISRRNGATGKMHLDLKKANYLQLTGEGLSAAHIDLSELCTYSRQADFFSARRLGTNSGRMLSGILMKNN